MNSNCRETTSKRNQDQSRTEILRGEQRENTTQEDHKQSITGTPHGEQREIANHAGRKQEIRSKPNQNRDPTWVIEEGNQPRRWEQTRTRKELDPNQDVNQRAQSSAEVAIVLV